MTYTGSTANLLTRENNSRDLLGKLHKDRSIWIRATTPTNSHPSWHMEGADVLDTKIQQEYEKI